MPVLLQVEALTKSYGDRLLFGDVTFGINEGDKIGIIAKNGIGKSTMLSIIAGTESADSGSVTFASGVRVGYLEQSPVFTPGHSVMQACLQGDNAMCRAISEYEQAIASGDPDAVNSASAAMDAASAWEFEDRARDMLTRLGIDDVNLQTDKLSGGQAKRVALARVLLGEPDLLILDEPTNHLDIDVIEWLEQLLSRSRITLLMVTHDRYFLDRVTNRIIEIDMQSIYTYDGGYDYYLRRRQERIEAMSAQLDKVRNTLRRETEWMRRQPQARAGKAQYRIDAYHKLQQTRRELSSRDDSRISLDVKATYIGSKIFEADNVSKRFGDKIILRDFSYTFARYERVGIIGHNGVGKSTFIKMLLGIIAPDSGTWDIGDTVRFGYYSQEGIEFTPGKKVIDAVTEIADDIVIEGERRLSPMQWLTRFLFSPADQQKYIETLSGGEKARLHLATVLMRQPNFLILDEPTNDLDIVTLGLLEEYLASFNGCLIVVSHDRFFLDSIVDHLFVMEGNGVIRDFPGSYSDYRASVSAERQQAQPPLQSSQKSGLQRPKRDNSNKMTWAEKREFQQLEEDLETLNKERDELDTLFNSGQLLDNVATLSARYSELATLIDEKEMRWLELSEKDQ